MKSTWRTNKVGKLGMPMTLGILFRIRGYELLRIVDDDEDRYWRTWPLKKQGKKTRIITSPREPLRSILKEKIFPRIENLPVSKICFGFKKGTSIVKNIELHLRARAVFSFDIKDAFPSVTREMVRNTFMREMKFTEQMASFLAKLVTYKGKLPQGSHCSPAIFNLVYKPMDRTISGYLSKSKGFHFTATRYADNYTISSTRRFIPNPVKENLSGIVKRYGFEINPEKTRYAEGKAVPRITGLIIVNGKTRIRRHLIERFRGMIHNRTLTPSQVRGIISYTRMTMGHLPKRIANPYFAYLRWWYREVCYPEKYTKEYTIQDFFTKRY